MYNIPLELERVEKFGILWQKRPKKYVKRRFWGDMRAFFEYNDGYMKLVVPLKSL